MAWIQPTINFKNNLSIHKDWLLGSDSNIPKPQSKPQRKRTSDTQPKSPPSKRRIQQGQENVDSIGDAKEKSNGEGHKNSEHSGSRINKYPSSSSSSSASSSQTAQRPDMAAPLVQQPLRQPSKLLPDDFSDLELDISSDDLPVKITTQPKPKPKTTNLIKPAEKTIPSTMSILATPTTKNNFSTTPSAAKLMELLNLYRKLRHAPHDQNLLAQIDEQEAELQRPVPPIELIFDTPARQVKVPSILDEMADEIADEMIDDEVVIIPPSPKRNELKPRDPNNEKVEDSPQLPPKTTEIEPIEIDSDDLNSDFSIIQIDHPNDPESSYSLNPFGPGTTLFPSSSLNQFDDSLDNIEPPRRQGNEIGASTQGILDIGIGDDGDDGDDELDSDICVIEKNPQEDEFPWTKEVYTVLRQRFMLNEFRANQLHAINGTLEGRDVLVLMPTGGGKSLCYQLPALVNGGKTRGLTVVISPLISLMQDQTEALAAKNISSAMFNSAQTAQERKQTLSALMGGDIALLYVSPEMFQQSSVMQSCLQKLHEQNRLARIVIDEAHCVSSWGHDFRPDYKALVNVKTRFPGTPIMALTATANEKVRMDIQGCLRANRRFYKQSFNRPNLYYEVRTKSKGFIQEIEDMLRDRFKNKTGIIYCHSKQACETTANSLQSAGIKADFYHAGMETDQRASVQANWQSGRIQVVCATIAFGMGIDKADVRYVIHTTMPRNMEGYYQETGRAGRDGLPSTCIVFFNQKDARMMLFHISTDEFLGANGKVDWELTKRQRAHHRELMQGVINYCENRVDCRRVQVLRYFGEVFDPKLCRNSCDNCRHGHEYTQVVMDVTEVSKNTVKMISHATQKNINITPGYCNDLLRGSSIKKIKDSGHDSLPGYGAGKTYDRSTIERIITHLICIKGLKAHTERNRSGFALTYLRPDEQWRDILEGKKKVSIVTHVHGKASGASPALQRKHTGLPPDGPIGFEKASDYARRTNSFGDTAINPVPEPKAATRSRTTLHRPKTTISSTPLPKKQVSVQQTIPATNASKAKTLRLSQEAVLNKHKDEAFRRLEEVRSDYCNDQSLTRPSSVCSEFVLEVLCEDLPNNYNEFAKVLPDHKRLYPVFAPALKELRQQRERLLGKPSLKDQFAFSQTTK